MYQLRQPSPARPLGARPVHLTLAIAALSLLASACGQKSIPARGDAPGVERFLEGGELVFEDRFDRAELGDAWKSEHASWRIVDGWVHSTDPKNKGLWLNELLPEGPVRVEFVARSEPLSDGSFPGDLKCEIFAETQTHEAGYVLINGGWNNQLDVIARLDEHGDDRLAQTSKPVVRSTAHRWAVVRVDGDLHWFRDGELVMSYRDAAPLKGRYFGFNNWLTNAYFDDLRIYRLTGG